METREQTRNVKIALASGSNLGAIAVIQLSGRGAAEVLSPFFANIPINPNTIRMGTFRDRETRSIDQVLVAKLPGAGERYDITCHGGVRIFQRIIDVLTHAGAQLVPAENLLDTTFNLDNPVACEAYHLLVNAKTNLAVKFLLAQAHGDLNEVIARRDPKNVQAALTYWPAVRFLIEGLTIALAGPPNAGKSTLLNRLSASDQALVADFPGTTRDCVQSQIDLGGLPVELIDTAGLGETDDPLGGEAQNRAADAIHFADCILVVLDATRTEESKTFLNDFTRRFRPTRAIVLINKIDDPQKQLTAADIDIRWPILEVSALNEINLERISTLIHRVIGLEGLDFRKPAVFTPLLAQMIQK